MKKKLFAIVSALVLLTALGLIAYPTVSDIFALHSQSRVVESYNEIVRHMDRTELLKMIEDARAYNDRLSRNPDRFHFTEAEREEYNSLLNLDGRRIIGSLDIGFIGVSLPIYHGTETDTLLMGLGHFEGSSLPVGGPGSHTVVTGHRGLPSATLLSNIDRMVVGDVFTISVLGEKLVYQVDQIVVVEPYDYSEMRIYPGKDYATLLTCTPYGINTHRLLIRGERVESTEEIPPERVVIIPEVIIANNYMLILIILAGLLALIIAIIIIRKARKSKKRRQAGH